MDKSFHPTLYWVRDYLSMLGLKLNHACIFPSQKASNVESVSTPWCHLSSSNCTLTFTCTFHHRKYQRKIIGLNNICKFHLTQWGRMMHICLSKLTVIGSDNGLAPTRCQAIIWTNAGIMLIWTLGTYFSEILSEIHTFSFKKMPLKMLSAKLCLFHLGLNLLKIALWVNCYNFH